MKKLFCLMLSALIIVSMLTITQSSAEIKNPNPELEQISSIDAIRNSLKLVWNDEFGGDIGCGAEKQALITTNGTLLAKWGDELLNCGVNSTENNVRPGKKENKLIESSVYKMNISLHSFEDQGQEYLTKYLSDVVDFVEKAKNHHIIIVLRLWNKGSENAFDQEIISFLRSRLDGEWTENENGFKIRNRLHISWSEPFGWPDINGEYLGDEVSYYGTRDHFGILADGTVVPCCLDSEGAIPLGNVFKEALEDILSSPRTMSIMQGFGMRKAVEELCKRCPYARKF